MNDIAIRVENLSKLYGIGAKQESYKTLRDTLAGAAAAPFRRIRSTFQRSDVQTFERSNAFWALKDVSLEVKRGEVVGIIGRNGAGKSTLLKILSRITEPTGGYADIYGRVGSLLEVGTGFHPELTGRENIYLNGAILGMKREEIHRRFDEIVEFAEVEQFVDTPIKHYSSGMYLRLAFAVAAHLEPEILLVDEVLAVGDAQFQKKCLGKLGEVAREGRTVLFVSHNMAAISHLCSSSFLLQQGQMVYTGPSEKIIEKYYLSIAEQVVSKDARLTGSRPSWARRLISSVRILDTQGRPKSTFPLGADITIEMTFVVEDGIPLQKPDMGVVIHNAVLGTTGAVSMRMSNFHVENGLYATATLQCTLQRLPLLQGHYIIDVWLGDGITNIDTLSGCASFIIEEADIYKSGIPPFGNVGSIFFEPQWNFHSN